MFCPKCGKPNPDDAQFCGDCGNPLPTTEPAPTAARPGRSAGPTAAATAVSRELKIGIIIATLIVPLVGIIMGAVYMADANPEKKAVGKTWLLVGIGIVIVYCALAGLGGGLGY